MLEEERELEYAERLVKQRQIQTRETRKLGKLAGKVLGKYGVAAETSTREIATHWSHIVGHEDAQKTAVGVKRGRKLEIICANNLVIQKLMFRKQEILAKLNQQDPNLKISELIFRSGNLPRSRAN